MCLDHRVMFLRKTSKVYARLHMIDDINGIILAPVLRVVIQP